MSETTDEAEDERRRDRQLLTELAGDRRPRDRRLAEVSVQHAAQPLEVLVPQRTVEPEVLADRLEPLRRGLDAADGGREVAGQQAQQGEQMTLATNRAPTIIPRRRTQNQITAPPFRPITPARTGFTVRAPSRLTPRPHDEWRRRSERSRRTSGTRTPAARR